MAGRLAGKVAVVTGAAPRGEGVGNGMATAMHVRPRGRQGGAGQSQRRARRKTRQADQGRGRRGFGLCRRRRQGRRGRGDGRVCGKDLRPARHPAQQRRHRCAGHAGDGDAGRLAQGAGGQPHHHHAVHQVLHPRDEEGRWRLDHHGVVDRGRGRPDGQRRRRRLFDGQGRPARLHPVGGGRLCDAEHPRQLHHRGLGAHADGGPSRRRGARAAQEDGAHADRGHGVGHRLRRGLSRLGRIALGDRRAAADRWRAGGARPWPR